VYDVIIIGGGPAGLTAGIYASRSKLKTILLETSLIGGKMSEAWEIENFPGFPRIGGYDLAQLMFQQAISFGLEHLQREVSAVEIRNDIKTIKTGGGDYAGRAAIITGGSERQKLGVPGEKEFLGRGVSFCSTCDGPFFRGRTVAVVGGGNVAVSEALHLTSFASKVYIIHRRDQLRATPVMADKAKQHPIIEIIWDSVVEAIEGDGAVEKVRLTNVKTGEKSELKLDGVFISIGLKPNTAYLKNLLELDEQGGIMVNDKMETSAPGIYAAGDIRHNSIRQAIAAAGDGAVAATYVQKYLSE